MGSAPDQRQLDGADLTFADLFEARLTNRAFATPRSPRSNLGANLLRADLSGVSGERAIFVRATMRGANLAGAILKQADFFQADLVEADLTGADLQGARLAAAKLFNAVQIDTKFQGAIMPDNSVHP
jgi:uncharacterized protein YjbI with pentapeptide repeats